ncbi:hypothetical protein HYZ70_02695 [Candidatus Curtissbacteria bacterium]|nr:hypothetical protein [Candidatus Curtissbacteria bacterium]
MNTKFIVISVLLMILLVACSGVTLPTGSTAATPQTAMPTKALGCRVIHESVVVETMGHVSTSGSQIHLEFWWEGQPEKETFFNATQGAGGRFNFTRPLKGWVWEYADCSDAEVRAQIDAHIPRRRAGGANNAGYVQWETTGLFSPAKKP